MDNFSGSEEQKQWHWSGLKLINENPELRGKGIADTEVKDPSAIKVPSFTPGLDQDMALHAPLAAEDRNSVFRIPAFRAHSAFCYLNPLQM